MVQHNGCPRGHPLCCTAYCRDLKLLNDSRKRGKGISSDGENHHRTVPGRVVSLYPDRKISVRTQRFSFGRPEQTCFCCEWKSLPAFGSRMKPLIFEFKLSRPLRRDATKILKSTVEFKSRRQILLSKKIMCNASPTNTRWASLSTPSMLRVLVAETPHSCCALMRSLSHTYWATSTVYF